MAKGICLRERVAQCQKTLQSSEPAAIYCMLISCEFPQLTQPGTVQSTQGSKQVPALFLALPWPGLAWPALGGGRALQRDSAAWPEGKARGLWQTFTIEEDTGANTTTKSWVGQGETAWVYLPPHRSILYRNISDREPQCTRKGSAAGKKNHSSYFKQNGFDSGNHWDS